MSWNRRLMLAEAVKDGEMELDYLTIIPEGGNVTIGLETWCYMEDDGSWVYAEILGSPDGGATWYDMPIAQGFTIPQGEKLLLKANYYDFITENESKFGDNTYPARIVCLEGHFSVEGTLLSLAHGDDFKTRRELATGMFIQLFNAYNTPVHGLIRINNPESFLPSTELSAGCYSGMFGYCSELKNAPALPATALAPWCYDNMFNSCTSLIEAPELPATELVEHCYSFMFSHCTSLTKAPILPAKTLTTKCYTGMFNECENLNYIEAMFTTTPSDDYTSYWVDGVSSTGTFVMSKDADWYVLGIYGIPENWTVQTK